MSGKLKRQTNKEIQVDRYQNTEGEHAKQMDEQENHGFTERKRKRCEMRAGKMVSVQENVPSKEKLTEEKGMDAVRRRGHEPEARTMGRADVKARGDRCTEGGKQAGETEKTGGKRRGPRDK